MYKASKVLNLTTLLRLPNQLQFLNGIQQRLPLIIILINQNPFSFKVLSHIAHIFACIPAECQPVFLFVWVRGCVAVLECKEGFLFVLWVFWLVHFCQESVVTLMDLLYRVVLYVASVVMLSHIVFSRFYFHRFIVVLLRTSKRWRFAWEIRHIASSQS